MHKPVLLDQMIEYLNPGDGKTYLDCTFGAGGYSKKILESSRCTVIALDQDYDVIPIAREVEKKYPQNFRFISGNFVEAKHLLDTIGVAKLDGIVMDLGVSSMQFDTPERGFSFRYDFDLDMRMNNQSGIKAKDWLQAVREEELANVIYNYGEETASRRIAAKIIEARQKSPIETTGQLAEIVRSALGNRYSKKDLATKTFQAIRIFINKELSSLEDFLPQTLDLLKIGGRLVVVSFHSLEDNIVKNFLKQTVVKKVARSKYSSVKVEHENNKYQLLVNKPVTPSRSEILDNSRARSAKLRAAVKIS